jgi:coenzyme PQQ biosynthesis protein PqqD
VSGPARYLKPADRTLTQQVSGTVVLLSPDNGEYYALNEVGSRVWELCDGTRNVSDVVTTICQEYDAPAETVEADVLELIEDLIREKLVVEDTKAAGPPAATATPV